MSDHAYQPRRGEFAPAQPTDLRSPCPMINCLANHGFLPRDGRNINAQELYEAISAVGLGFVVASGFVTLVFQEHPPARSSSKSPHKQQQQRPASSGLVGWLTQLWRTTTTTMTPWAARGLRRPGHTDALGRPVLDLADLSRPGAIEHDISLTRRDHQQPQGNTALQRDLVAAVLAASTDGQVVTRADLARVRAQRIMATEHGSVDDQGERNPAARYGALEHLLGCGEIALLLGLLGDGERVPLPYLRALLADERLPLREGWAPRRRWWRRLGFVEMQVYVLRVWRLVGIRG